jgi:hypothetical protein
VLPEPIHLDNPEDFISLLIALPFSLYPPFLLV